MAKLNRSIITITYFSLCSFALFACAAAQTGQLNKTTAQPTPTTNSNQTTQTSDTPKIKGKLQKLSEQPLEIRLFFAPNYNLTEDEKDGQYPDDSPKWAQHIETEVRDVDLNHDLMPERMIILTTDPFGREINPDTYDVYLFRLEAKKWKPLNREPFYEVDKIEFIKAQQKGDYDEIRYPDFRVIGDEQTGETSIEIISVNRFSKGEYREVECRDLKTGEIVSDCPPGKTAND